MWISGLSPSTGNVSCDSEIVKKKQNNNNNNNNNNKKNKTKNNNKSKSQKWINVEFMNFMSSSYELWVGITKKSRTY